MLNSLTSTGATYDLGQGQVDAQQDLSSPASTMSWHPYQAFQKLHIHFTGFYLVIFNIVSVVGKC
jgi:hypothetical protein